MTLSSDISTTSTALSDIKQAIIAKGVTPSGNITTYAAAISNIPSGGGTGIPREVSQQGVYQTPTESFTFSLPQGATNLADYSLDRAFRRSGITSIDLSSITNLTGSFALERVCEYCNNLTSVDLSNLQTINTGDTGSSTGKAFSYAFANCTNLTNINLSNLETITSSYMMAGYTFDSCFSNCSSLSSVTFDKLKTVNNNYAFNYMFQGCASLTTVRFPLLDTILATPSSFSGNGNCFSRAFQSCPNLSNIYFNSLKTTSFGSTNKNQFQNMLNRTGTTKTHTLHFPSNMESTISGLQGYPLFGGSSGYVTLSFDLPATS